MVCRDPLLQPRCFTVAMECLHDTHDENTVRLTARMRSRMASDIWGPFGSAGESFEVIGWCCRL